MNTPENQKKRVLVMDDEELVLAMARQMLKYMGCTAELTEDGAAAVDAYRQALECESPFNLVILDLTVHEGMGGGEAAKLILKLDPEAKIIVSSGYTNDPVMIDYASHGFVGALAKPYKMNKLREILQRC